MTITQKFMSLPRAGKWGVAAGTFLLVYFLGIEVALDRYNAWSSQADAKEAILKDWTGGSEKRKADETLVVNGRRTFGPSLFPGPEGERSLALRARIADVLQKHGVRSYTEKERPLLLGNGPLSTAAGTGARVRRIVRDVSFDCTPETLADIVADLERSQDVSAVSKLFIRKLTASGTRSSASRNVGVTLSVDTWAIAREGGAGGGGGGGGV